MLRFLRQGGAYAADFVDRCLDLIDWLALPNRSSLDPTDLGLPRRIVDEALRLAELAELAELDLTSVRAARYSSATYGGGRSQGSAGPGRDDDCDEAGLPSVRAERPQIRIDPYNNGVVLWLPPVGEAPDGRAVWTVTADAVVNRVRTQSIWPGGAETVFPLNRPVRSIDVRLDDSPLRYEVPLVDKDDPLLVFAEDGVAVGPGESLPSGPVWLLHPRPEEFAGQDLQTTGHAPRELADVPPPYGWTGWLLRHVDLTAVTAIGYAARLRPVHTARRAYLELSAPHRDATTMLGAPVLSVPPRLSLSVEDTPVSWAVRVRRPSALETLSGQDITVGDDGPEDLHDGGEIAGAGRDGLDVRWVDPWVGLPRPLLGAYEITVRGPLGRGLTRTVELAEGLVVHSDPPWREMGPGGLAPAGMTVRWASDGAGVGHPAVSPKRIALRGHEVAAHVTVSVHGHSRQLLVSAPHMAVRRVVPGARSTWSYQPLRLHAETDARGELLVQIPAAMHAELVVRVGDRELQRVRPTRDRQAMVARFDLARLADTVAAHRRAVVDVDLDGVWIPVISYSPRRLASGVQIDPIGAEPIEVEPIEEESGRTTRAEALRAHGFAGITGVVAGCYQLCAPWRPPVRVELDASGGAAPLPAELHDAGPLLVMLRLDDPWVPVDWPDWPDPRDRDDVYLLRDRSWQPPPEAMGSTAAEVGLSAYLAGRGGPPRFPGAADAALRLYRVAEDLRRLGIPRDARPAAAALLAVDPAAASTGGWTTWGGCWRRWDAPVTRSSSSTVCGPCSRTTRGRAIPGIDGSPPSPRPASAWCTSSTTSGSSRAWSPPTTGCGSAGDAAPSPR